MINRVHRKRGWLFRVTLPFTHWFITNLSVTIGYIFFRVFNRTKISGKEEVAVRPEGFRLAGQHKVKFEANGLSTGVYYLRMLAGRFAQTHRMMLMK